MLEKVKAVIFDMDGTLIDSMGVWGKIDREFLTKRQIPVPKDIQKSIEGMSFRETAAYFKERFVLAESLEEIMNEWVSMCTIYYENDVLLKPGALKLVKYLHEHGYKIGLGTSSRRELINIVLGRYGLLEYFDTIRTSCEVGRGKPFPDIFLKVADDLGVDPAECLVFEDTLAGVTAGKRAGMRVVAVYDEHSVPVREEIVSTADGYIQDFNEFECCKEIA